jgi:hypothetical protein
MVVHQGVALVGFLQHGIKRNPGICQQLEIIDLQGFFGYNIDGELISFGKEADNGKTG